MSVDIDDAIWIVDEVERQEKDIDRLAAHSKARDATYEVLSKALDSYKAKVAILTAMAANNKARGIAAEDDVERLEAAISKATKGFQYCSECDGPQRLAALRSITATRPCAPGPATTSATGS